MEKRLKTEKLCTIRPECWGDFGTFHHKLIVFFDLFAFYLHHGGCLKAGKGNARCKWCRAADMFLRGIKVISKA
jgi:hypothetical protein